MLLVHAGALAGLRRELIRNNGPVQARRMMMRAGYASGERDAVLARQVRPSGSPFETFSVGPQLHMLEGMVQVTPESMEMDAARGQFHGVFRWDHSWEAEVHLRDFGRQEQPACWSLLGYASGYTSAFMGRRVLFKEVACVACGAPHCRIEGRVLEDWPDAQEMLHDYDADTMIGLVGDLQQQVETLRSTLEHTEGMSELIGRSAAFEQALALLRKAASTRVSVMLTGETGVGKEVFARALHAWSDRADKPFVAVNCAALPGELVESELFGTERGAFTGASASRAGRFERANGGTLMLDELGDLPLSAQAKLLRVLQDGEVERLGGTTARKVDVRIVAATNVDLEAAVARGAFRRDLLYRLNVYPIRIPPLRERTEDIEPLAQHLLQRFCALHGKRLHGLTDRALVALRAHSWPGNVRELENLIERGVILAAPGGTVDAGDLFTGPPSPAPQVSVSAGGSLQPQTVGDDMGLFDEVRRRGLSLDDLEDALIREAVRRCGGNQSAAARELGLTRAQLTYRLQRIRKLENPDPQG